ncbi:hypothetical protein EDD98_7137 [Streptomyces sp. PanSC19]|uniref:hypothetical protein n=1 Tax=Streptomyces sp. PanSC19 TaxID=1520455 RepID=UPI000FAFD5D3|nr:hypothetical protein [Streptomyces sp. PanSC19]ROQ24528.1 hypothetical protein EDD98_7137 [Streptomyces sp. PanSC19]
MIGVLVGAVASYVGGALMERSRWRRQLSTRWDERRLECYLRLADVVKRFTSLAGRLAAGKGLFDLPQPLAREAGLELLAEAELERGYAFEAVLLMGDAESISAARSLQRHAWVLEQFVRDMHPGTSDDWMRAFREFQEKRDEFCIAARNSLGVHAKFRMRSEDPAILSPDARHL